MAEAGKPAVYEPNEEQKRRLGKMLQNALLEIRVMGWNGDATRAADLADAFHTLPTFIFMPEFDWLIFRELVRSYQTKYPRAPHSPFMDYVKALDEIETMNEQ